MRPKLRRAEELTKERLSRMEASRDGGDRADLVRVIEQIEEAHARGENYVERNQPTQYVIEELRTAGYRVHATRSALYGERVTISWE